MDKRYKTRGLNLALVNPDVSDLEVLSSEDGYYDNNS